MGADLHNTDGELEERGVSGGGGGDEKEERDTRVCGSESAAWKNNGPEPSVRSERTVFPGKDTQKGPG